MSRLLTRPWPLAVIVGAAAEALFACRVATPHKPVFDEVHYVTAGRFLLTLQGAANKEHPLFGKTLIALFGDNPVGWRIVSTLAATGVVTGVLAVVIAAAFDHCTRYWDEAYLVVVAVLFIHFYPILAATALPGPQAFLHWMWLKSWI